MKKKRKFKNIILKAYATIVFFIWCLSACSLDSPSWTPLIVCVIASALLVWFAWANGAFRGCDDDVH